MYFVPNGIESYFDIVGSCKSVRVECKVYLLQGLK